MMSKFKISLVVKLLFVSHVLANMDSTTRVPGKSTPFGIDEMDSVPNSLSELCGGSMDGDQLDLLVLDQGHQWNVTYFDASDGERHDFMFSLCRPLDFPDRNSTCHDKHVCHLINGVVQEGYAYQRYTKENFHFADYSVFYAGPSCSHVPGMLKQVIINFECDQHLGSPSHFMSNRCSTDFVWYTSAACSRPLYKSAESPCVIYDSEGRRRDLSGLMKAGGGYYTVDLSSQPDLSATTNKGTSNAMTTLRGEDKLYINVCSDASNICGPNVVACRKVIDEYNRNVTQVLGDVRFSNLYWDAANVEVALQYLGGSSTHGCKRNSFPSVELHFKCPADRKTHRSADSSPVLRTAHYPDCDYIVDWETEHACNIDALTTSVSTCHFTNVDHGVEVDLRPLKNKHWEIKNISVPDASGRIQNYDATLSICSGLGNDFGCDGKQFKTLTGCLKGTSHHEGETELERETQEIPIAFQSTDATLKYIEGEAELTYYGKTNKCPQTDPPSKMKTVIRFLCDESDDDSDGTPVFVSAGNCSYNFEFHTRHACAKIDSQDLPQCTLLADRKYFNLRPLSSLTHAYQALDKKTGDIYQINPCKEIHNRLDLVTVTRCQKKDQNDTSSCGDKYQSLGNVLGQHLEYEKSTGNLIMSYKYGDRTPECDNRQLTSTIRFICGNMTLAPRFLSRTMNSTVCQVDFEWKAHEACSLQELAQSSYELTLINGSIHDPSLNANIYVQPLLNSSFEIDVPSGHSRRDNYTYLVNLSSPSSRNLSACADAAVCQYSQQTNFARDIGSRNTVRFFRHRNELRLVVTSNDRTQPCKGRKEKSVQSVFKLQCSSDADGVGRPAFLYESVDCDYVFSWETVLTCPAGSIPYPRDSIYPLLSPFAAVGDNDERETALSGAKTPAGHSYFISLVAILLVICLTATLLYFTKWGDAVFSRARRALHPSVETTFHYHQVTRYNATSTNGSTIRGRGGGNDSPTDSDDVAFITTSTSANGVPCIFISSVRHVPYHASYNDDSDVDLLT